MSFYIYDIGFLVLFTAFVVWFLYSRRHNLKREGVLYLYRTRLGVKFINYVGGRYKRTLSVLGFIGVVVGYGLMISVMYFLYLLVYVYLFRPEMVREIKIPPLMPLIPYLPEAFNVSFLPPFYFTYWIIAIAVLATFHEFAHGVMAKRYDVRVLTTGFGFLGPFLAAFVEPDEKQMEKKPKYQQIAILSAGVFTNLVLAFLFFLMLSGFFVLTYVPAGAMFNTYTPGLVEVGKISAIDGKILESASKQGILNLIEENNLTDDLILGDGELKLTKVIANGKTYYTTIESLKSQLKKNVKKVGLYEDLPAINAGLRGAIIEVDGVEIKDYDDLADVLESYKVGDVVKIKTKDYNDKNKILEYELELAESPDGKGDAVIGIGYFSSGERILGKVANFFIFFKKPATYYEPRFHVDLIVFIYNLIWWLALINLSVALINMWPVAIFDGGRMFMLSVWAVTGSERFAQMMFKLMTYLILGALLLLMVGWFNALF